MASPTHNEVLTSSFMAFLVNTRMHLQYGDDEHESDFGTPLFRLQEDELSDSR